MNNNSSNGSGLSLLGVLTIVFVVLKLTKVIAGLGGGFWPHLDSGSLTYRIRNYYANHRRYHIFIH